ncbi:MAG: SHOCT domain-containing protein [Synergistes sp.]|nr:SHOCT domain-containing protein [Synergistes sp.]
MAATKDSGQGCGTNGSPQRSIYEIIYPEQLAVNENTGSYNKPPIYEPSPKHNQSGWGSNNPIRTQAEGQRLLDSGYRYGKQIYNITESGAIVKFQPDNTPNNGYHSYEVSALKDIPADILKQMRDDGKITRAEYNKIRKGKK